MSVFRAFLLGFCGLVLAGTEAHASSVLKEVKELFVPGTPLPPAVVEGHPEAWAWLERYNGTITRAEFEEALRLFDPKQALLKQSLIDDHGLTVYPTSEKTGTPDVHIAFAPPYEKTKIADFRTPETFRSLPKPVGKPLLGLRIALDPGHIGGEWGQVEDRSIYYEGVGRLQEGDLNLITAALLARQLTDLGATVFPTRTQPVPVTDLRPADLLVEAKETILKKHPETSATSISASRLELMSHLLFERKYEFLARGAKIRNEFPKADLTIVLYINATPSSGSGRLIGPNQNIFFVEGAYLPEEVADPDIRFRMLYKAFAQVTPVEYDVAAAIGRAFHRRTGLPPVPYGNSENTRLVRDDNYDVVARNLGASRQDDGPVVTTEPFFMNNRLSAKRFIAGDYEGEREFEGKMYRSIFRDYAECVLQGVLEAYGPVLPTTPTVTAQ